MTSPNGETIPFDSSLKISYIAPPDTEFPPLLLYPDIWTPGSMIFGYSRASDDKQENSPEMQQEKIKARVEFLDGVWAGVFCDFDVSGRWVPFQKRPVGQMLIRHFLAAGDKIVVDRLDRLARSMEGPRLVQWCYRNRIDLYVCESPTGERLDLTNANQIMFINIWFAFAQWESDLKGQRVKEAIASLKRRGLPWYGAHRFGWVRQVQVDKHGNVRKVYVAHEKERQQIRTIQKLHDEGMMFKDIWALFKSHNEMQADGTPWAKVLPCGQLNLGAIVDACRWYECMMDANNYVENWEDWSIARRDTRHKARWRSKIGQQDRQADAELRSRGPADEPLPDLPTPSQRKECKIE